VAVGSKVGVSLGWLGAAVAGMGVALAVLVGTPGCAVGEGGGSGADAQAVRRMARINKWLILESNGDFIYMERSPIQANDDKWYLF